MSTPQVIIIWVFLPAPHQIYLCIQYRLSEILMWNRGGISFFRFLFSGTDLKCVWESKIYCDRVRGIWWDVGRRDFHLASPRICSSFPKISKILKIYFDHWVNLLKKFLQNYFQISIFDKKKYFWKSTSSLNFKFSN